MHVAMANGAPIVPAAAIGGAMARADRQSCLAAAPGAHAGCSITPRSSSAPVRYRIYWQPIQVAPADVERVSHEVGACGKSSARFIQRGGRPLPVFSSSRGSHARGAARAARPLIPLIRCPGESRPTVGRRPSGRHAIRCHGDIHNKS
jgi:hypothetical protein